MLLFVREDVSCTITRLPACVHPAEATSIQCDLNAPSPTSNFSIYDSPSHIDCAQLRLHNHSPITFRVLTHYFHTENESPLQLPWEHQVGNNNGANTKRAREVLQLFAMRVKGIAKAKENLGRSSNAFCRLEPGRALNRPAPRKSEQRQRANPEKRVFANRTIKRQEKMINRTGYSADVR